MGRVDNRGLKDKREAENDMEKERNKAGWRSRNESLLQHRTVEGWGGGWGQTE